MTPTLQRVVRLDSMPINRTYFTPEGYLMDRPILTSTGIFEYHNADGTTRRELRLPEDVFDSESLKSYKGKPIIITHDAGLITKDNVGDNEVGTILSEGLRTGDDVRADIVIHNTDEMKERGLKELSLGYNLDLEETSGIWQGEHYDAIQRNIRINHLALVREARAGEQARLNIDSRDSDTLIGGKAVMKNPKKADRNDGILSPEELQTAIEEYKAKRAEQEAGDKAEEPKAEEEPVVQHTEEVEQPEEQPSKEEPAPVKEEETEPEEEAPEEEESAEEEPEEEESEEVVKEEETEETEEPEEQPEPKTVDEKLKFVKDRRNHRDEEGDPKDMHHAMYQIATQDEDIDMLHDIIDTLLAQREYGKVNTDSEDDEEEMVEPLDDEDEFNDDEDDFDVEESKEEDFGSDEEFEDEEFAEDEDDEFEEEDEIEEETEEEPEYIRTDSVDEIINQKVELALVGRQLNLDGLEKGSVRSGRVAVVKAMKPSMNLDGKSDAYISAAYDCVVEELQHRKGTDYQKKQMFNRDSKHEESDGESAINARTKMVERMLSKKI